MSATICINHSKRIFGQNMHQLKLECEQEELEPDYGCIWETPMTPMTPFH